VWVAAGAGSLPGVIAGVLLASAGTGILLPTLIAWSVGRIPFASRGRSTGVWTSAFFLGQFVTPIVIGVIQGALAIEVAVAIGIVGIVCAVVVVVLAIVVKPGPIVGHSTDDAKVAVAV
jgi:MFS family permease